MVCVFLRKLWEKGQQEYRGFGKAVGVCLVVLLVLLSKVGADRNVKAAESGRLPVVFFNEKGQRILIRSGAVYEPEGDFYMALPKEIFSDEKRQELTVILVDLESGERRERTLTLK